MLVPLVMAVSDLPLGCDGFGDDVGVRVEVEQRMRYCLVQILCMEPRTLTAVAAVPDAGEAGVVSVGAALAVGRRTDVFVPALRARDQPCQVVRRVRRRSARTWFTSRCQDLLDFLEEIRVDDRRVRVDNVDVAEHLLPDVRRLPSMRPIV